MHAQDQAQLARMLATMPSRYTWTACPLTRNISKHSPVLMRDMMRRIEKLHMDGESEDTYVESIRDDGLTFTLKRRFPNKKTDFAGKSLSDALRTMMGKDTYKSDDNLPESHVELRTQIDAKGWSLNQGKLRVEALPQTIIASIIAGELDINDIVSSPYLDGFSIHSICHGGQTYKDGVVSDLDANVILGVSASKANLEMVEIMLEGAHDYRRVIMPKTTP